MRSERMVTVQTGLCETVDRSEGRIQGTFRVHARTRIEVQIERHGEAFNDLPEVGDPWCPLTVRARLERMNEAYNRQPKVRPGREKCAMPAVVREKWKDAAKDPKEDEGRKDREAEDADLNAAYQIVDVLSESERLIAWPIACQKSDLWLGKRLGCHNMTAAKRKQKMLTHLAIKWNGLGFRPDAEDVRRARKFLHREI